MSQEGLKLLKNKPKKAQAIKASEVGGGSSKGASATSSAAPSSSSSSSSSSSVSAAAASYKMGTPPPPQPQPPQESFARRYKFMWPLLLGVNLVVGVYYFTRTRNQTAGKSAEVSTDSSPSTMTSTAAAMLDDKPAPVLQPVRIIEPIPDNQQRDLFKWILNEKRKVKPKDPEEKKRLNEEKAILKHFIRAESIPPL